ncbi:aminotransferase class V-fold PLP-dependent enzyme [Geminocystis sp. CENA526]|uniref:aminotransferase class V-fold PLP-dependent enzyme n=1 Tax=Geminocystis sp. CENA526 TaxID=1355871 RepID=UPI003D6F8701
MIDILKHREEFTGLQDKYYFNYGGQGILPRSSLKKIIESYHYLEEIGVFSLKSNSWVQKIIQETKKAIADEIDVTPDTIALTENVTASCNIPLWGMNWQQGDEILLTDAEHPGVIAIIKEISRRFGVKIVTCPMVATLNEGNPVTVIENHLTAKTKLLVISHILWNTGQVLPLKEIVSLCHNYFHYPIPVLVDGAQSAGSLPLDLLESQVDYYGCTGHKWLCGAAGVGFLYVRQDLISQLPPTFIGWRSLNYSKSDLPLSDSASRYEVATSAYPLFCALQSSIELHQQWGTIEQRYNRICELSRYLWLKLNQISGIECLKQTPPASGLVSFYLRNGQDANKVVKILEEKGFYLRTLVSPYCIRACVHYFTLESEIDALVNFLDNM